MLLHFYRCALELYGYVQSCNWTMSASNTVLLEYPYQTVPGVMLMPLTEHIMIDFGKAGQGNSVRAGWCQTLTQEGVWTESQEALIA